VSGNPRKDRPSWCKGARCEHLTEHCVKCWVVLALTNRVIGRGQDMASNRRNVKSEPSTTRRSGTGLTLMGYGKRDCLNNSTGYPVTNNVWAQYARGRATLSGLGHLALERPSPSPRRRGHGQCSLSGWNVGGCRIRKDNDAGWINLENLPARRQIGLIGPLQVNAKFNRQPGLVQLLSGGEHLVLTA
jgi:hypothetical protein